MGDKTQLATVALAAKFQSIMGVWLGTTTGMLVADAIGIGVGIVLGKKLPDRLIKWLAALIFILFGVIGLYDSLPLGWWVSSLVATGCLLIVLLAGMRWRSAKMELASNKPAMIDAAMEKGLTTHQGLTGCN